jgi:hypothetical protein
MQNDFINASRYRSLEKEIGVIDALHHLAREIGSSGALKIMSVPEEMAGEGPVQAQFVDIAIQGAGGYVHGEQHGLGATSDEALADLLHRLLAPPDQGQFDRSESGKLEVGPSAATKRVIEVRP